MHEKESNYRHLHFVGNRSLVPIPMRLKDGGTVAYNAILYRVEDVHRIDPEATSADDYLEGTIVKILGIEVYNDVE